jgi:HD superfamily phosphodiesterase
MNIIEIYKKYHLPENLQMHMLRVAGCSNLIIDNWTGMQIDKEAIIRVCLLHDMGNMVKIPEDASNDKQFLEIRKKYFEKYGTNDHEINLEIGKLEGLTPKEIIILDGKRSRKNAETLKSDSYEIKICAYCDQRVAPDGVVGIKEHYLIECSLGIEKQIMEHCRIQPEDINDNSIEKYIEQLRKYEI